MSDRDSTLNDMTGLTTVNALTGSCKPTLIAAYPGASGRRFDVILAADVVEHVRNPRALIREASALLSDDGVLLACVPNFGHWYPRVRSALVFSTMTSAASWTKARTVLYSAKLRAAGALGGS